MRGVCPLGGLINANVDVKPPGHKIHQQLILNLFTIPRKQYRICAWQRGGKTGGVYFRVIDSQRKEPSACARLAAEESVNLALEHVRGTGIRAAYGVGHDPRREFITLKRCAQCSFKHNVPPRDVFVLRDIGA